MDPFKITYLWVLTQSTLYKIEFSITYERGSEVLTARWRSPMPPKATDRHIAKSIAPPVQNDSRMIFAKNSISYELSRKGSMVSGSTLADAIVHATNGR